MSEETSNAVLDDKQVLNKIIILDTNIFFADPRFEHSTWLLLRRFDYKIGLPFVVLDETIPKLLNNYRGKIKTLRESVKSLRTTLRQIQENPFELGVNVPNPEFLEQAFSFLETLSYDIPENLLHIHAGFLTAIGNKTYSEVLLIPYTTISHQKLVDRCLSAMKPFKNSQDENASKVGNEQNPKPSKTAEGWRDALIWFSIRVMLRSCVLKN
jgi:hypothetical protein